MADLLVVDELRDYLVAQAVVQAQDAAPSPSIPSVWVDVREGAPEPRRDDAGGWGEDATVTLVDTGLGSPSTMEPWVEETFVDVVVRARSAGRAQLVQRTIRGLLVPGDKPGGRKAWEMGALHVERSFQFRRDQSLPTTNGGLTYDRVQTFCIQARLAELTTP